MGHFQQFLAKRINEGTDERYMNLLETNSHVERASQFLQAAKEQILSTLQLQVTAHDQWRSYTQRVQVIEKAIDHMIQGVDHLSQQVVQLSHNL